MLCPKHVTSVVDAVSERLRGCRPEQEEAGNLALDRLAQIVLVALHTESLSGSLSE